MGWDRQLDRRVPTTPKVARIAHPASSHLRVQILGVGVQSGGVVFRLLLGFSGVQARLPGDSNLADPGFRAGLNPIKKNGQARPGLSEVAVAGASLPPLKTITKRRARPGVNEVGVAGAGVHRAPHLQPRGQRACHGLLVR